MQSEDPEDLPARIVTVDQVVAINIRYWRRAAGLTQSQLGAAAGLSPANVSALEASADGGRERRRFDAQSMAALAAALGLPLLALLLPPSDEGGSVRYELDMPGLAGRSVRTMTDLLTLMMPDSVSDSPVMDVYRSRLRSAVSSHLGPDWVEDVNYWLRDQTTAEERAERAEALRAAADSLALARAEYLRLADLITRPKGKP